MKKHQNLLMVVVISAILLSIVIVGCTQQVENKDDKGQQWDYKPMISKESHVYGDTGNTKESLSEDWVLLGKVDEKVSQTEPMVKGKTYFVSNTLPVKTEIYWNKKDRKIIYAKYNDTFIKYELNEE
ncbi:hypothetical protein [Alkaliphilus hydrothermalis]|uniref:Competence protein ComGC n=1 Tax=Alkaliphilus hydrothermalis TaxID=1482730 RepID=A0ABS2NN18_9FIRM|nr:hypothetical protein [Alkaliphilus hydrothermalis]MBM7614345.1 competence protein ComGC [Alkaliphilus hydrothermalis]